MPLYNYKCNQCNYEFELIQKMSDKKPDCPICQSEVSKQLGASRFILKGKGWADEGYQKKD